MNKEPQIQSKEERLERNAQVITSQLVSWFNSKHSNEPTREGDFQFAAELLESAIYDKNLDYQLTVRASDAPINTCDLTGTRGSGIDVSPSYRGPLMPGEELSLEVFRKLHNARLGAYTSTKSNVYVGTFAQYIELGDLAKSLADGAELTYESPLRDKMHQKWDEVVMPHVGDEKKELAEQVIAKIIDSYNEESRAYHNLRHIVDCLEKLEPYKDRDDYLQLVLAVFLHDETYDPSASDNEEVSAFNAGVYMEELDLPGVDDVQRLILSTKSHLPELEDEKLMCSIDMSILAAEMYEYHIYSKGILKEYEDTVPRYIYIAERIKFLKSLDKPLTHPDFEHLNEKAHENIAREISWLSTL